MKKSLVIVLLMAILMTVVLPRLLFSNPWFLAISGGSSPHRNQVAHEKNILYIQSILGSKNWSNSRISIFFSDGLSPTPDVCYIDQKLKVSYLQESLHLLFANYDNIRLSYKNNSLTSVNGPALKNNINNWFNTYAGDIKGNDNLYIYCTDHGGINPNDSNNNYIELWNNEKLYVDELTKLLNKINPKTRVILIMAQCYSGSFSNVIWENGTPDNKLSEASRCGFFSSRKDLISAGCTPDLNEANYDDYSSRIFAALHSKDRLGHAIPLVDYDNDGKTSLIEAHYYCVLNENTIDTPITTSETYLRKRLFPVNIYNYTFSEVMDKAMPIERRVLGELLENNNLKAPSVSEVKRQFEDLEKLIQRYIDKAKKVRLNISKFKSMVKQKLAFYHPILDNPYHPKYHNYVQVHADKILTFLSQMAEFKQLNANKKEYEIYQREIIRIRKSVVKLLRVEQLVETILLTNLLMANNNSKLIAEYNKIKQCEKSTFD